MLKRRFHTLLCLGLLAKAGSDAFAADAPDRAPVVAPTPALAGALSPEKWREVESSVDRALAWISTQQSPDGSFPSRPVAQPAITSFCVMAFLSRGYTPGAGPYGRQLEKAVDYVVSCQQADGLLCREIPGDTYEFKTASHTAAYNHAIAGLMLSEVYGEVSGARAKSVRSAIQHALQYTRALQSRPKPEEDRGGWGYIRQSQSWLDGDLSVTAWHLMFLRSAKNAEFNVPKEYADEAVAYVRRNWDPGQRVFLYHRRSSATRGLMGAGILSLALAGEHHSAIALSAGDWLLQHPFASFGQMIGGLDRYYYSLYYCTQAAAQLGGRYWTGIYPPAVETILKAQLPDGSCPLEPNTEDREFGQCYSTSLAVLAMTPAYQLLPVYQR